MPAPIHMSNVMLLDPKSGEPTASVARKWMVNWYAILKNPEKSLSDELHTEIKTIL
jgi:ribosomal protein L24